MIAIVARAVLFILRNVQWQNHVANSQIRLHEDELLALIRRDSQRSSQPEP